MYGSPGQTLNPNGSDATVTVQRRGNWLFVFTIRFMNNVLLPMLLQSFIHFLQGVIPVLKQWQNIMEFDCFVVLKGEARL